MRRQFSYAGRIRLGLRSTVLAATILLNLVFGFCGYAGVYGVAGKTTAVTLCSIALFAIMVVSIIADFDSIKDLFCGPSGYNVFLTPVPRWKILAGRIIPIVVMDLVALTVGSIGVTAQSLLLVNDFIRFDRPMVRDSLWFLLVLLLYYTLFILLLFFAGALRGSLLYRMPGRTIFSILLVCVTAYAFSLTNLILSPFGLHHSYRGFHSVTVEMGFNPGMILFILLLVIKLAAIFVTTTYLMERKINL